MKILQIIIITVLALTAPVAMAQRTTRTNLRPKKKTEAVERVVLIVPDTTDFAIAGFNKPLNSIYETFLFTNLSLQTITEISFTINYYDTSNRKLHRQVRKITQTVNPGETLLIEYPSFDRQHAYYYHLSRQPRVEATPFRVTISIDSLRVLENPAY